MILLKVNDLFHDVNKVNTLGKLQIFNVEVGGTYCIHTVQRVNGSILHHKETDLSVRPNISWIGHE